MNRLLVAIFAGLAAITTAFVSTPNEALAEGVKRVAIHVDENDPKRMSMALNNAANILGIMMRLARPSRSAWWPTVQVCICCAKTRRQ